jgi:hypothetical protein
MLPARDELYFIAEIAIRAVGQKMDYNGRTGEYGNHAPFQP